MTTYRGALRPAADEMSDATGLIDPLLHGLLSIATPHKHENLLSKYFPKGCIIDKMGNRIYNIGKLKDHGTIFSCHMDTVHAKVINLVPVITDDKFVYAENIGGEPEILGADDRLGVYIMIRMMEAKIPGKYIFHVGEEYGGLGSKFIVKNTPQVLEGAKRAIAFDRANYGDIINRQLGGECCSDEFVKAMADMINPLMPPKQKFSASSGTFTDTASYIYHVPECTNLSVAYSNQHTSGEHFDYVWLQNILLPAILKMEWHKLPVGRDHEAALKKQLEWQDRQRKYQYPAYSQWPNYRSSGAKPEQPKLPLPANQPKNKEKKIEKNKNGLPFKDVTFNTPLWQVPDLRPFNVLPDNHEDIQLGIKAALHKRLEVAGSYQFMHDVYCVMRNFKTVMGEINKQLANVNALRENNKREIAALCDNHAAEILKRDNEIIAQRAVIEDLKLRLKDAISQPSKTVH